MDLVRRLATGAIIAAATAGCVGDANTAADAGSDAADASDVVDAAPSDGAGDVIGDSGLACDKSKPFNAPVAVGGVKGESVWLSNDERTIYPTQFFADAGAGPSYLVAMQTRATTADAFGVSTILDINDKSANGFRATLTGDGLVIIFASYRTGPGASLQLFTANRSSPLANFSTPVSMANVNNGTWEQFPSLSADGLELYFDSQRDNAEGDVFHALGSAQSAFNAPSKIDLGAGNARTPVISPDGLALYFFTTRASAMGDIWVAVRTTKSDGFGAPNPVTEVNTSGASEVPNWVSPDGCRLYFTRRDPSATVMVASRPLL